MKKNILCLLLCASLTNLFAQFPPYVKPIEAKANATIRIKGNIAQGVEMPRLDWAWKSTTACFPSTQKDKFTGKHSLHSTVLPPRAKMYINLIPDNPDDNMSVYAYSIGTTNYSTVPNLSSCVSCEAEFKWDYPKAGKTQNHTRKIMLNAINNPYNVVIGVAGADGLKIGGYTLEIQMLGGEPATSTAQKTVVVTPISSQANSTVSIKGNLSQGVLIHDLSWASNSSVACFPATQNTKFRGNHVVYSTTIPKYSIMDITVVPDDPKADFSIYAYEVGLNSNAIIPNLPSCVSCEAEHKWDYPKKGKTQDHTRTVSLNAINNPYKVVIGVVGANGLQSGGYTLKVSLKAR